MNKRSLYYVAFGLLLIIAACNANNKTSNMAPLIIENNQIKTSFFAHPHSSINISELQRHLEKYPERWNAAFDFLAKVDTTNLELGRTDLSEDVFVNVAEYVPNAVDQSSYESHKNYIDVQYVISGQEFIAVNDTSKLTVIKPYDEEKDYMNYKYDDQKLLLANQKEFFVFFPTDAHMPSVRVDKKDKVKKLVIKIRYN